MYLAQETALRIGVSGLLSPSARTYRTATGLQPDMVPLRRLASAGVHGARPFTEAPSEPAPIEGGTTAVTSSPGIRGRSRIV